MKDLDLVSIDPSGTGTTAICHRQIIQGVKIIKFEEFYSTDWRKQLEWVVEYLKNCPPVENRIVVYEYSNYLNRNKGFDTVNLFRLMGGLEALKYIFPIKVTQVYVRGVKECADKFKSKELILPNLNFKMGRGNGWKYTLPSGEVVKLSDHMRDAYFIGYLYQTNSYLKIENYQSKKKSTSKTRLKTLKSKFRSSPVRP